MNASLGKAVKGRIFDVQRFCMHDGPGIRTTVFFQGCPLRCVWCHNPEGIHPRPQLSFIPAKCIGCGYCFRVCPHQAHRMDPERGHVIDREKCARCGLCAKECYASALEMVGREVDVAEIMDEVMRDKPFYDTSGGGMTLSGGEPTMQIDFAEALLVEGRALGLHRCVETCGFADWSRYERLLPLVDLFLFDVKETNPDLHEDFTGAPVEPILRNLERLHERGASILLRLPIIPGHNDREEHFAAVADLFRRMPGLKGAELIPYHRMGEGKTDRFGLEAARRPQVESPDPATVKMWIEKLRAFGARVVNDVEGGEAKA
jgi:pyruvate formate lyase activating enzyme